LHCNAIAGMRVFCKAWSWRLHIQKCKAAKILFEKHALKWSTAFLSVCTSCLLGIFALYLGMWPSSGVWLSNVQAASNSSKVFRSGVAPQVTNKKYGALFLHISSELSRGEYTDSTKSHYNWRSASQHVEPILGLVTRYYFLSEGCFLKFAVLALWGALSDER
jgi:hypothetical protein